jgi:spermidine synthase
MFDDGLKFVKEAPDGAYDLILGDSTDPAGPGEGLFTTEFYRDCYRVLSDNGILINQHEGAFYDGDIEEMKKAHAKIRKTFPISKVFGFNTPPTPPDTGISASGPRNSILLPIEAEIWKQFGLKTKYYNVDLHKGAFALPNYVQDILASVEV